MRWARPDGADLSDLPVEGDSRPSLSGHGSTEPAQQEGEGWEFSHTERTYQKFKKEYYKTEQGEEDYKALRDIRDRFAAALKKPDAVPALFKSKAVHAFRGRLWDQVVDSEEMQELADDYFVVDQTYSGGGWQWHVIPDLDFAPKPRKVVVEGFKQSGTGVAKANVNIEFRLEWEDWKMEVTDYSGAGYGGY